MGSALSTTSASQSLAHAAGQLETNYTRRLLTFGARPTSTGEGGKRQPENCEPPLKRVRTDRDSAVDNDQRFETCPVFPHADREVARLHRDAFTAGESGNQVVGQLTDTAEFRQAYPIGKGCPSPHFEHVIAKRAPNLVWELAKDSKHHHNSPYPSPSTGASKVQYAGTTGHGNLYETPIPVPRPPYHPIAPQLRSWSQPPMPVNAPCAFTVLAPRYSASPIPPPNPPGKDAAPRIVAARQIAPFRDVAHFRGETNGREALAFRSHRPYLSTREREQITTAAHNTTALLSTAFHLSISTPFHYDFTNSEMETIRQHVRFLLRLDAQARKEAREDLRDMISTPTDLSLDDFAESACRSGKIKDRDKKGIINFFRDLKRRRISYSPMLLTVERGRRGIQSTLSCSSRIQSLLQAREISGACGFGSMRRSTNYTSQFRTSHEDGLELRAEWTNCAGDIATVTWVSNETFICGTTEHSDSHNQQYNKPGNLVLGSFSLGTVKSYPEHRIIRPIPSHGDNSTEAMRESQDPWLYSSVVSSDFDATHERAFTSGFDRTVKIWKVHKSGKAMKMVGEWKHTGNVNFVVASKHTSGMIATAADVPSSAIRIYTINEENISASSYRSYATEAELKNVSTDKWAYFPATLQWGRHDSVKHLLLVGYSPRSQTGDDNDIPEDRHKTGELALWDGLRGKSWVITSATTQNVFEVLWHPSQPCFIAATSPLGLDIDEGVRTHIRIFCRVRNPEYGGEVFSPFKTLDCLAADINELNIMPNSVQSCYVTAGCTDGNTYVWDSARSGGAPMHILPHGEPGEDFRFRDREREDTGVKFTAWGNTLDRFYTGSSDGRIKVWNIRSIDEPLVRDLLEVPAPVSSGMFSPDRTKLVIGDASGRIFLLSIDENAYKEERSPMLSLQIPVETRQSRILQYSKPILPHPDPPAPSYDADGNLVAANTGPARGKLYLEKQQLVLHSNPTLGALKGPKYFETGLFRREYHQGDDHSAPLLAAFESQQQSSGKLLGQGGIPLFTPVTLSLRGIKPKLSVQRLHSQNQASSFDLTSLSGEVKEEFGKLGVNVYDTVDENLDYDSD